LRKIKKHVIIKGEFVMKSKKILSILLSVVMCFGVLGTAFSASAASVSVHLLTNQKSNKSANVYGTYKYYWGSNNRNSADVVEFIPKYKSGAIWYSEGAYEMSPGESLDEAHARRTAHKFNDERYWHLKLKTKNDGTGCDAWGYIKNA